MTQENLIFSGDFVCPDAKLAARAFRGLDRNFLEAPKVMNFEGSLRDCSGNKLTRGVALLSDAKSLDTLRQLNVVCVTMANNHVTDYDVKFDKQKKRFLASGIKPIGFGMNRREAAKPYICDESKVIVLTFGWEVIRCRYSTSTTFGINPYIYTYVENQVVKYRSMYPWYKLIVTIHGNYEFERYPQPADREFAHYLVDLGVDAIIGHHPHVVSGCEEYRGKPIFYSLGNFYMPEVEYEGYQLSFHKEARIGLSVKLGERIEDVDIFLHRQSALGDSVTLISQEKMMESDYLAKRSDFRGMCHQEYLSFFEAHKFHKKKLLPTFRSFRNKGENRLKSWFVKLRQIPVDLRSKIKGKDSR